MTPEKVAEVLYHWLVSLSILTDRTPEPSVLGVLNARVVVHQLAVSYYPVTLGMFDKCLTLDNK